MTTLIDTFNQLICQKFVNQFQRFFRRHTDNRLYTKLLKQINSLLANSSNKNHIYSFVAQPARNNAWFMRRRNNLIGLFDFPTNNISN